MLGLLLTTGCSTYTDHTRDTQQAVVNGDIERGVHFLNEHLEVENLTEQPADLEGQKTLFLLERATLLQALGDYASASRDMIVIDDRMEWVDIQSDNADSILRYTYSDSTGSYRAPAHERLLLNTMNMINFLARGDTSGARVEARRFDVLQRFFLDDGSRQIISDILGFGNYLAAIAFEASGQYSSAVRFYSLAYAHGTWPEPDEERLLDLLAFTDYRGGGLGDMRDRLDSVFERLDSHPRPSRSTYREKHQTGDTLFVIQTGMVPYRQAERIGIERALRRSHRSPHVHIHLTTESSEQALKLVSMGVLNWLNTTSLSYDGIPSKRSVSLTVDGQTLRLQHPIDLASQVEESWDAIANTALAAAISRAIVRAGVGQGTRKATEAVARQSETLQGASSLIGWLVGTTVQTSLAAADTPDTRSWISLPSDIYLVRTQLPEGPQQVEVNVGGRRDVRTVDINPHRFQLFNFSRVR